MEGRGEVELPLGPDRVDARAVSARRRDEVADPRTGRKAEHARSRDGTHDLDDDLASGSEPAPGSTRPAPDDPAAPDPPGTTRAAPPSTTTAPSDAPENARTKATTANAMAATTVATTFRIAGDISA